MSVGESGNDPLVGYSTKELLARIEQNVREGNARLEVKVDSLISQLWQKADKTDLVVITQRLALLEAFQERQVLTESQRNGPLIAKGEKYMEKVDVLEQSAVTIKSLNAYRKYIWGTVVLGGGGLLLSAYAVIARIHH